jgi:hypothetical protein
MREVKYAPSCEKVVDESRQEKDNRINLYGEHLI